MARTFLGADWTKAHVAKWKDWIAPFVGKQGIIGLQVGFYEGRSSCWFCEEVLTGQRSMLIDVDPLWNRDDIFERYRVNVAGLNIETIRQPFALAYSKIVPRKVHYAYVDGDHAAANTLADGCMAWHLLQPGGVLIFDDYAWTSRTRPIPPGRGIDAFLSCYADRIQGYEVATGQVCVWKPAK